MEKHFESNQRGRMKRPNVPMSFVAELGISDGTRPQEPVKREEMWVMIFRNNKLNGGN